VSDEVDPRLLAVLRDAGPVPEGARKRVRAKLAAVVPGMNPGRGGTGGGAGPSTPAAAGSVASGALRIPAAIVAAFVVGGASGFALHAALNTPAPPRVVFLDRVVPGPSAAPTTDPAPGPSALLDEARAGLVAGDPASALKRLEEHQHRFLNPLLAEERDAMWIEALVRAGRTDEARRRADAFRRKYPGSLFLPTVDSAVGTNP
jgi:hypothetical protein